ncbi:MAG TPA: hypothetical protein VNO55_12115 [Polyangia bacterium]|nr:hypothetical protein [Polyangia bacterium]
MRPRQGLFWDLRRREQGRTIRESGGGLSREQDHFVAVATKAERFRAELERSGPKRTKRPKRSTQAAQRKRRVGDGAAPSASTSHNYAPRAEKTSAYDIEFAAPHQRPSRKSTRKSHNHIKTDSTLRIANMNQVASPEARARRGGR